MDGLEDMTHDIQTTWKADFDTNLCLMTFIMKSLIGNFRQQRAEVYTGQGVPKKRYKN